MSSLSSVNMSCTSKCKGGKISGNLQENNILLIIHDIATIAQVKLILILMVESKGNTL